MAQEISFAVSKKYPARHKSAYAMSVFFFFLLAGGYIAFRSSSFFTTPLLELEQPNDGAMITGGDVVIRGSTEPKSEMSVNGMAFYSNEEGRFEMSLPLDRGFHILDIRSKNRIGREARVVRRIVVE